MRPPSLFSAWPVLFFSGASAFVTLDNSGPHQDTVATPPAEAVVQAKPLPAETPKVRSVLFLGGNDQRVYAAMGLLKALQENHLAPDKVVAEGAAALPAAAFVLGYSMDALDSMLREHPLESCLESVAKLPSTAPPDPRWTEAEELPWRLGGRAEADRCPGHPWLSWRIADLVRRAPDTAARRGDGAIRLGLQLFEARSGALRLWEAGDLQEAIKASVYPAGSPLCEPDRKWLGAGATGGMPRPEAWPWLPEHLVFLDAASLPLRPLSASSPLDSLRSNWRSAPQAPVASGTAWMPLELARDPGFRADSSGAWMDMGYKAALRSLDALKALFNGNASPGEPAKSGEDARLWSNAVVESQGNGSYQLLRQRLRYATRAGGVDEWMAETRRGGFYSNLETDWQPPAHPGDPDGLVLTAHEHAGLEVRGGAAVQTMGQPVWRHWPEAAVSAAWSQPYYLPFQVLAAAQGGGSRPGLGGQFSVEPPWSLWIRLSMYEILREYRFTPPDAAWKRAGADSLLMRELQGGLRLGIGPSPRQSLTWEVRRTDLRDLNPLPDTTTLEVQVVDFLATLLLQTESGPQHPLHARFALTSGYREPTAITGLLRDAYAFYRVEMLANWRGWEVFGKARFTHKALPPSEDVYDAWLLGSENPLSFGNQVWVPRWRSALGGGVNTAWRRMGFRLVAGSATRLLLLPYQQERLARVFFWDAGVSLASPIGPWRLACGGYGNYGPFAALQWGTHLDLEQLLSNSGM